MARIQSQDIVFAVYLLTNNKPWTFQSVGDAMGMSTSQVHLSWNRLINSQLVDRELRRTIRANLLEFLIHGVKYCFPAKEADRGQGMETGHRHQAMQPYLVSTWDADRYVWSGSPGKTIGIGIEPLHRSAIKVAKSSRDAYAILAALDCLRLGKSRERDAAARLLSRFSDQESR